MKIQLRSVLLVAAAVGGCFFLTTSDALALCCDAVPGICSECCPNGCGCVSSPDGLDCECTGCGSAGIVPAESMFSVAIKHLHAKMALSLLSSRTKMNLSAPTLGQAEITIVGENMTFDQLLAEIGRQLDATPVFVSDTKTIEFLSPIDLAERTFSKGISDTPMNLNANNLDIGSALRLVATQAGADFVMPLNLEGTVTCDSLERDWMGAVQMSLRRSGNRGWAKVNPSGLVRIEIDSRGGSRK